MLLPTTSGTFGTMPAEAMPSEAGAGTEAVPMPTEGLQESSRC